MKYLLLLMALVGCENPYRSEYKCINGHIYLKDGNVWVEALAYEKNKCADVVPTQAEEKE